jgi:hypothetical protein
VVLIGMGLIVFGVAMLSIPGGVILAGVFCVATGLFLARIKGWLNGKS